MARFVGIKNEDIYTSIFDYSVPKRSRPSFGQVSYAQLRQGSVQINGREVPTAPLSSLKKAREIAALLKEWIQRGEFLLQEPGRAPSPGAKAKTIGDQDRRGGGPMSKRRVVLTFPPSLVELPITYRLVKDFDLKINIMRAHISPKEEGKLVLEVEDGSAEQVEAGLRFLEDQGDPGEAAEQGNQVGSGILRPLRGLHRGLPVPGPLHEPRVGAGL